MVAIADFPYVSRGLWDTFVRSFGDVKGRKYNLSALLRCSTTRQIDASQLVLIITFDHQSHRERMEDELESSDVRDLILEKSLEVFNVAYRIEVTSEALFPTSMHQVYRRAVSQMGLTVLPKPECGCSGSHIAFDLKSPCWQAMMLVEDLRRQGIDLVNNGDVLVVKPKSKVSKVDRQLLKQLKPHIMRYITDGSDS